MKRETWENAIGNCEHHLALSTWARRRFRSEGGEEPVHQHLSLSVLTHLMSVYHQVDVRQDAYKWIYSHGIIEEPHASLCTVLYIHMFCTRRQRMFFFFLTSHLPHINTLLLCSITSFSLLLPLTMFMQEWPISQLMCNLTCWRSLSSVLRGKSIATGLKVHQNLWGKLFFYHTNTNIKTLFFLLNMLLWILRSGLQGG